jgi:hypothetical protein
MRARAVMGVMTFQARVDTDSGWLRLTVLGDLFEVSHPFPLARFLNGLDYCYRAEDTTVELVPGSWHDWIEIGGQPGTGLSAMRIGRRKMTRQIWDALVRAGAKPIGPPPQP